MKLETQQEIVRALNQLFDDLSNWLRRQGRSKTEVVAVFNAAMRENGMLATLVLARAFDMLPVKPISKVGAAQAEKALIRFRSGEFATWLLSQPEPLPEELDQILLVTKSVLPNLRQDLLRSGELGPRHRRGGRPKEIAEPEEREKIREAIKRLRGPGVLLQELFQRMAAKHGVSPTTIKRIWAEKTDSDRLVP